MAKQRFQYRDGSPFSGISVSITIGFPCPDQSCAARFIPTKSNCMEALRTASDERRQHALEVHQITIPVYTPPAKFSESSRTVHEWFEAGKAARKRKAAAAMGYSSS